MIRTTKFLILKLMKVFGIFAICRLVTRSKVRILCYHGVSTTDEHRFQPWLFMSPELFRERMMWLKANGYSIVRLDEAITALERRKTGKCWTVVTIDDGLFETFNTALPILREFGFPATVYVATYYAETNTPVFNVLIAYLFWKTEAQEIDLASIDSNLHGLFELKDSVQCGQARTALLNYGDNHLGPKDRQALAERVAFELGIDAMLLKKRRVFELMTLEEIARAIDMGFDIQLHTHRHRFPLEDEALMAQEIVQNRVVLEAAGAVNLVHFCYPSGVWHSKAFEVLRRSGVRSATTTERGLNDSSTHPLRLHRFVDGTNVTSIEFEAVMCGAYGLVDWAMDLFQRLIGRRP